MADCGQETCERWNGDGCPCRVLDLAPKIADCGSCGEAGAELNECPKSRRACGHHCNHVWEQDVCHWCGKEFGVDDEPECPTGGQHEPLASGDARDGGPVFCRKCQTPLRHASGEPGGSRDRG